MPSLKLDNSSVINFAYSPGNPPYKDTEPEISVICHNQHLQGRNNFHNFELTKIELNSKHHSPHSLRDRDVVLWTPQYVYVLAISGVSDY